MKSAVRMGEKLNTPGLDSKGDGWLARMGSAAMVTENLPAPISFSADAVIAGWIVLASVYAFFVFGWDKHCAGKRGKTRVPEIHLLAASAVVGLPGAIAGMLIFRHKTAKTMFKLKFAVAVAIWAGLIWVYVRTMRP